MDIVAWIGGALIEQRNLMEKDLLVELEGPLDGRANMARDVALLDRVESGCVVRARVYAWDGPWVSLGSFQRPERDLLPGCPAQWVMRPTGGKAVLHGHDVTVGLAVSMALLSELSGEASENLSRSVKTVYRLVCRPLIEALRDCGIPAILGEHSPSAGKGPHTADCFAHVSANDIANEKTGEKVCGCALKLTPSVVLVQASIPAGKPLVEPATVFAEPAEMAWSPVECEPVAEALEEALGRFARR